MHKKLLDVLYVILIKQKRSAVSGEYSHTASQNLCKSWHAFFWESWNRKAMGREEHFCQDDNFDRHYSKFIQ